MHEGCVSLHHKGMFSLEELSFTPPEPKKVLGIDVGEKYYDIKRLFYKKYAKMVSARGDDPEDILQEVFKGLLQRNRGRCPYDPAKAAFSTYVMMVSHCVVSNYYKKKNSYTSREEQLDENSYRLESDGGKAKREMEGGLIVQEARLSFKEDVRRVFDLLLEGCKMTHISRVLNISLKEVQKKVAFIRADLAPKIGTPALC